jgi:ATP/maltotriose-dependent transcriptional regulator MalT
LGATSQEDLAAALEQDMLALYREARPLHAHEGSSLRLANQMEPAFVAEIPVQFQAEFPRATVYSQPLDGGHRMLLVVHQRANDGQLSASNAEVLQAVAGHLGKLLTCLLIWISRPEALGAPFDRLTDREWMVLRGLNSECGEKQLADELGLSPHTLHSHIKSIYRKLGVQGRLPMLLRAQEAIRGLRIRQMNAHGPKVEEPTNLGTAIAV